MNSKHLQEEMAGKRFILYCVRAILLSNSLPYRFNQQVLEKLLVQEVSLYNRSIFHYIVQKEPIGTQKHVHHLIAVIFNALGNFLSDRYRERYSFIDALYQFSLGYQSQNGQQSIRLCGFIAILLHIAKPNITAVVTQTVEQSISKEIAIFRCSLLWR